MAGDIRPVSVNIADRLMFWQKEKLGNITATAADGIPTVTRVTATMLFCPAAGELMAANTQIRLVTGLTTTMLFIRH